MNLSEKKQRIINEITSTEDEQFVDEIYELLDTDVAEEINTDNLSEEIKSKLFRAIDDYKQGRYISHEQMKEKLQQWLIK